LNRRFVFLKEDEKLLSYTGAGTGTAPEPVSKLLKVLGAGSGTGSVPVPVSG
jgi:hypothetical protein